MKRIMQGVFSVALAVGLASAAQAAGTPIVYWDHDFGTTEKTGTDGNTYTFDLNGNTLMADGAIKITGSNGAKINISTGRSTATVIMKYRNLAKVSDAKAYLLTAYTSQNFDEGISTTDNDVLTTKGYFSTSATGYGTAYTLSEGSGYVQFAYTAGGNFYMATIPENTAIGSGTGGTQSGLKFSNTTVTGLGLGGIRGTAQSGWSTTWQNVEIESVAVFDGYKAIADGNIKDYRFPSDVVNDAYLWLDASDASSILKDDSGAVTNWTSQNASGKAAKAYTANTITSGPSVSRYALNGKDIVDFGDAGSKKDLEYDRSSTIRTVFMVADVATGTQNVFFLGDHGGSNYNFHRGPNGTYFNSTHGSLFANGTVRRNGVAVASPSSTQVPSGFGLYTLVSTGNANSNCICEDRNDGSRNGGKKIAELLIFNKTLSDAEIAYVENYLMTKWLTSPVSKGVKWGNLGSAGNGIATKQDGAFGSSPWTVNFAADDGMVNTGVGQTGRVKVNSLTLMKRENKASVPTSVTLTQGGVSITSGSPTTVSDLKIYKSDGTTVLATREGAKFTFEALDVFDVSKNITMTFNGGNGCSVVQPANSVMHYNSTWSPAIEFDCDYDATPTYGRTISINFGATADARKVTGTYGIVPSSKWTNFSANGNTNNAKVSDDTEVSVTWSSANNYQKDAYTDAALKGYLDDGGSQVSISIANMPFAYYDVIIYQATDSNDYAFNPPSVNGTFYSYDGKTTGSKNDTTLKYGSSSAVRTATYGQNVVYLRKGFSGALTIAGGGNANGARGCIAAIQIVEVFPNSYEATVDATPATWSTLEGLTQTSGSIWQNGNGSTLRFSNTTVADATVNFDTYTEAGKLTLASGSDNATTFAGWSNTKFGAYDFNDAAGAVAFDATAASITADSNLRTVFRTGSDKKYVFTGSGSNGMTIDYGSTTAERIGANPLIGNHLVFDGGTHVFKSTSENASQNFGANATADNPTFYVKGGATLNWYSRNPCGWSPTVNKNGIIRIAENSKIKTMTSESGTWYWCQQFYLDPGASLELAAASTCLTGGADADKPHFFMPASENGTATISSSGSGSFRLTTDGHQGVGINVGEGSTLNVSATLATSAAGNTIGKFGAGTVKFTGNIGGYNGKLQVSAGEAVIETAYDMKATVTVASGATFVLGNADFTASGTIGGEGAVAKRGASTVKVTGSNTYTGGTTVEAGTLEVATPTGDYAVNGGTLVQNAPGSGAITVGAGGTFATAQDISAGGEFAKPTIAAVADGGTVSIQVTMSKDEVQNETEIAVATVQGDVTADDLTVTLVNADTKNTVTYTTRTADGIAYVKPQGAKQELTRTPDASGAFDWTVGSAFGDKQFRDYDNVTFATTAFTNAVNVASKVATTTLTVGGTYAFTNAILVAETLRTAEGADATFENTVIADSVVVTNGTVMAKEIVASDVAVTNATFGSKVVGPSMKYVRLSITATQGSGEKPAVGEFRLYRGSATTGYTIVDWPQGTKVTDSLGYVATKETANYPGEVCESQGRGGKDGNEKQPGDLIDGYYGNDDATQIYGGGSYHTPAYNKWWPNDQSAGPWVVTIEFPDPVATFSGCNFCLADYAPRNPTAWTIEVSSDGETWTTVNETTDADWGDGATYLWGGNDENTPAFLNSGTTPTDVKVGDGSTIVADGTWTAALEVGGNVTFKGVAGANLTLDAASTSKFDAGASLTFDLTAYDVTSAGEQFVVAGPTEGWPDVANITVVPDTFSLYKGTNGYYVVVESGNYWVGGTDGAGTWDVRNTKAWATNATETAKKLVWLNGGAAFFTRNAAVTVAADADITPTAINVTRNNDIGVSFAGAVTKLAGLPLAIGSTNVTVTFDSADAMTLGAIAAVAGSAPTIVLDGGATFALAANNQFSGGTIEVKEGTTLDIDGMTLTDVTIAGAGTVTGTPTVSGSLTVGENTTLTAVTLNDNAVLVLDDGATVDTITGAGYVKKVGSDETTIAAGAIHSSGQDAQPLKAIQVTEGTLRLGSAKTFYDGGNNRVGTPFVVTGGTLDLNGAYTWNATDGSGILTGKPITLGGTAATTVTGGNFTFYGSVGDCIVYDGGDGANEPATFAANWHSSYSDSTYSRNVNVGRGKGTDYDLLISGTVGLSGQFAGTTVHKTGAGTVKMTGAFNMPRLAIDAGAWKMGAANAVAATTTVGADGTLDVCGQTVTLSTLTSAGAIASTGSAGTLNVAALATVTGRVDDVTFVAKGGEITITNATLGANVQYVVDLDGAAVDTTPFTFENGSALYGQVTTRGGDGSLTYDTATHKIVFAKKLQDTMVWLPIGDSITEGESMMGHAGTDATCGGYRYQLWRQLTEGGQATRSVGFRTGHCGTVEDPATTPWAYHAAQYGGVISYDGTGTHGMMLFNVENTLENAGYPDVITVLLGVNDISFAYGKGLGDAGYTNVFNTVDALVTKLATLRPNAKILVSTLLPAGGSRPYIVPYNAILRDKSAANASPFNLPNVKLIDVNAQFGAYADGCFLSDHLHPNETGSIRVAKAFSGFVASAVGEIADANAKMVNVHNGEGTNVTVRFTKALADVATATLTLAGTDVDGHGVNLVLTNGTVDADDKRVMRFDIPQDAVLAGGVYTATLSAVSGTARDGKAIDTTALESKFVDITGTGAAANVTAAYRNGLVRYETVTLTDGTVTDGIGSGDNWAGNGPSDDQVVRDGLKGRFVKRVGYYVELKRQGKPAQFVWVSMNAFDSTLEKVGVPTVAAGIHKAVVGNLQVFGNRGNFTNTAITEGVVDTTQKGIVEFTPYDWAGTDETGTDYPAEMYGGKFGWNDTLAGTTTLKGGMQIARLTGEESPDKFTNFAAEMLFAFNNFNHDNAVDLGIGSFNTHRADTSGNSSTPVWDWTDFTSGAKYKDYAVNAYEVKKIEIWVELDSDKIATAEVSNGSAWSTLAWKTLAGAATTVPEDGEIILTAAADDATLTLDADTTQQFLAVECAAGKSIVISTNGTANVSFGAFDVAKCPGAVTLNFVTGATDIEAGTNTTVLAGGTGTLTIGAGMTATVLNGLWAGTVAPTAASTLRYAGTTALASVPYTGANSFAGTVVYAAPFADAADGLMFAGAMTRKFEEGFSISATRLVTGNNAGITQNFTQDGGSIAVTGTTQAGENTSSCLMAHWNSTVNYALKGGSLTVENVAMQFGLDGRIHMTVGGGDETATLRAKGVWQKSRNSASTLTLRDNGVLELGSDGLQFTKTSPSLTLAGGTIRAYEDTAVSVAHADGIRVTGPVTLDPDGHVLTLSGAVTGSGDITAAGAGTLVLSGDASSYAGVVTVSAGMTVKANAGWLTGGKIKFADATCNLVIFDQIAYDGSVDLAFAAESEQPASIAVRNAADETHEYGTVTVTGELPNLTARYTPWVSGKAASWAWEFNGSLASEGVNTGSMGQDHGPYYTDENDGVYAYSLPYSGHTWPAEFTTAIACTLPTNANVCLVGWGQASPGGIALTSGDVTKDEVKMVYWQNNATCTTLATMTVPNASTCEHLYVFSKTADGVKVYLDGSLVVNYTGALSLGVGVQIGTVYQGVGNTGLKRLDTFYPQGTNQCKSVVNSLRVYDAVLGENAIAALCEEFKYVSPNGTFSRALTGTEGAWKQASAWKRTKEGEATTQVDEPGANATVAISAAENATISNNLESGAVYEAINLTGAGTITITAAADNASKIRSSGNVKIGANAVIAYSAVDLASTPIEITAGKTLTIDASMIDLAKCFQSTVIPLTGLVTAADPSTQLVCTLPAEKAGRTVAFAENPSSHAYELTITVEEHPFVFTVAQDGEGQWTWGGQAIDEPDWTQLSSGAIEKTGNGVAELVPLANFTYDVKGGTLKFTEVPTAACAITNVAAGATFDLNGLSTTVDANVFTVVLNGGTLANTGSELGVVKYLTVLADSEVSLTTGSIAIQSKQGGWGATTIALGTNKLTLNKTGDTASRLELVTTSVTGTGTIDVESGTLWVQETSDFGTALVKVGENGVFQLRDDQAKTATVANIEGVEGGKLIASNGNFTDFTLTGTIELAGTGGYGIITLAEDAVAKVGTRRDFTFAGQGAVDAALTAAEYVTGATVKLFARDSGATTVVGTLADADGATIPADYYAVSDDGMSVTFKREAEIGTILYFTLNQALQNVNAGGTVKLVADVTANTAVTTAAGGAFDLDLAGYAFAPSAVVAVADGDTLNIVDSSANAGRVALGGNVTGNFVVKAGKYSETDAAAVVADGKLGEDLAFVALAVASDGYTKQVMPVQQDEQGAEIENAVVFPVVVNPDDEEKKEQVASVAIPLSFITENVTIGDAPVEAITSDNAADVSAALNAPRPKKDAEHPDASENNNGFTLNECYVLGLDTQDANSIPVVQSAQHAESDKVTLSLANVKVNAAAGVPVTFALIESTTPDFAEKTTGAGQPSSSFDVTLPTKAASPDAPVKYYRIGYRIGS